APAIRFRDVSVAYDGRTPVIRNFDLDVAPGQIVALTGASGAGKSSLLHLLLGLAPLSGGEVEIGAAKLGVDGDVAGRIAWASQQPIVVPGDLARNIALADPASCPGRVALA
ncbi:ATP-binding cassette domain-containing protein, partial [Lactiplantibacillus plantarum]|nr:ATP-binding cassette domain-containing protein [Lactiplantibacillus plantarum]